MNIVFAEFCGLGNSVLLSSTFRSLKNYKEFKIVYVGNNKFSGITIHKFSQYIDERIILSNLKPNIILKFFKNVSKCNFVIIPEHSNPNLLFLLICSFFPKKNIILSENFFKRLNYLKKIIFLLFAKVNNINFIKIKVPDNIHEIEINNKFIQPILNSKNQIKENIFSKYFDHPGDFNCIRKLKLENIKYFVIQPFCANGLNNFGKFSKNWPSKNFEILTEILLNNYKDSYIIFVGDHGDGKNFLNIPSSSRVLNLISKTTIEELISILKNSQFIICHDSSILHLSDSMSLKNLSLFGPTKFEKNKPHGSNSFFIRKSSMSLISPNDVFEIIQNNIK